MKSRSPWRSQVVIAKNATGKRRLVVDYASTINRFSTIDAFPVPLIPDVISKIHGYSFFSRLDMKSAYHQVPISFEDQPYTAFEADGQLWQFTRLPFGVTNGVPAFGRVIKDIIADLDGVESYFDDIIVCGRTQEEHDRNLKRFMSRASDVNLTLNQGKCTFSTKRLCFLGHCFEGGKMTPDAARLAPLMDFPVPTTVKQLERFIGLTVYYSKWVKDYASIAKSLFDAKKNHDLPLGT